MMQRLFEWLTASQQFFQGLGFAGVLAFAAVIMVAQIFLVPLSPLALAGGVFFGFWGGFTAITLGTGAGAIFNFLVARHLARGWLMGKLGNNAKFRQIDAAIGREGWKIVVLLRFCPIPYGLANYCYGLTAIPIAPYIVGTVCAIIPANLVLTWIGSTAQVGLGSLLGHERPRQPAEYALLAIGIICALAALTYIGRVARAAVARGERF